jgi:prolyl-tRNA editing enzyme YbaK/EbsC (Cys-tRNA(Pro) deacylase)
MELEYVILGSGSRSSKIKVSPSVLRKLTNVEIVEGLSLE